MIERCYFLHQTGDMENAGVFLLLLVAHSHCLPVLKDPQDEAMLYDETVANDTGLCHCVY